jgi:hypothetical protein
VAKLLPALDAFALTRAHLSDATAAAPEVKALLQAAGLVDVLAKEGLERIDDAGAPFDPTVHDAVEHAPAPEPTAPPAPAGGAAQRGDCRRRANAASATPDPVGRWWPTSCGRATGGRAV